MWQKVKIDEETYLINYYVVESIHKILITNLECLWFEKIPEKSLLARCKEMNKLIEANDDVLLGHALSLVEGNDGNTMRTLGSSNSNSKILNLQTSLKGLRFKIKFQLTEASHIQFYKEVTLQLLTTIAELEMRHNLLVDIIKSKDLEIMEYKLEGGRISRKAVETEPFDLQRFSENRGKDLSEIKSKVSANPSDAITTPLQDLFNKISTAPVHEFHNKPPEVEGQQSESKRTTILKLNSPSKNKKIKIYDDDDGEEEIKGNNSKVSTKDETEVKKSNGNIKSPSKGVSKRKFKLNL